MDVDTMAKVLCRIESRRTGRSFDEVVAPSIELWMRHRYEAEQLIEEMADWGYLIRAVDSDPEPWVDQDGVRWSDAKKAGYLSRGPSTFEFSYEPRDGWVTSTEHAYGPLESPDIITSTGENEESLGDAQYHAGEFWIDVLQRTVVRGPWSVVAASDSKR